MDSREIILILYTSLLLIGAVLCTMLTRNIKMLDRKVAIGIIWSITILLILLGVVIGGIIGIKFYI